jgi:DNA polymerase-3 subunit delta'
MTEPRANPDLIGHDEAARTLEEAARSGRLHHAWLISGAAGIGKATLAWRFGRWLLAGMPKGVAGQPPLHVPPENPVFRRVAAGAHPDVFLLEPSTGEKGGKKLILRPEEAREAIRFLTLSAAEGGWRVVIVDEADKADTLIVQNTLLKTLEEPPPRTVLLLTSARPQALLPTIRSRVRRLDLNPLPPEAMGPLLARLLPDMPAGERKALGAMAGGSPGRAVQLAEEDGLALAEMAREVLEGLGRAPPSQALIVADKLATDRTGGAFGVFFGVLRQAIARGVREAGMGQAAPGWVALRPLAEWSVLWDRLGRLAEETERLNLDRKQAVLTALSELRGR